jgi:hypothetical protein
MRESPEMPAYFARIQPLATMDAMSCEVAKSVHA